MAKSREPKPEPQQPEDSDEVSSSDYGSGSESESEAEQQTPAPKSSTQIPNPTHSSDTDDSLLGSDSDSDSDEAEPIVKKPEPASKMGLTQKSKSNLGSSDVKGSVVGVKRGAQKMVDYQDGKKPKKIENLVKKEGKYEGGSKKIENLVKEDGKSEGGLKKNDVLVKKDGKSQGAGNEDVSKKLFQRVFSEDDEIVLLKGMLDFTEKEKSDPVADIDEFVGFINKLLHFDVTKAQLLNKIKRLKGKYVNNAKRKFSKQHDGEGYELSKKIWGTVDKENNNVDGSMENGKENGSVMKKCAIMNVEDKVLLAAREVNGDGKLKGVSTDGISAMEQKIMSAEIKSLDREKQRYLEKKLSEIEVAELQLSAMRWEYMAEKARLIIASKTA